MTMANWLIIVTLSVALGSTATAQERAGTEYAQNELLRQLSQYHRPTDLGAMGRNRHSWFHARFQMGVHQHAHLAVQERDVAAADAYVRALEYTFAQQDADGGFRVVLPPALAAEYLEGPAAIDLASGTAFFLASAADGWLALHASPWFLSNAECASLRQRLHELLPQLELSATYLAAHAPQLLLADSRAPNRLLFNALAYYGLGNILDDDSLRSLGGEFRQAALALQHQDGYFLEGSGYDSSYNAVACAIGLRLQAAGDDDPELTLALAEAMRWQLSRITAAGDVLLEGNTRVRSEDGETFLGQTKGMDIPHLVEALYWYSRLHGATEVLPVAQRVIQRARNPRANGP
ncbi:MAG: hypothetical protein EA383_15895 [Spirochaetaceae bacterium]|nr:MAG: hypothetical protein EA383_15895 [Spirochaetaceae bacterium]